MRWNPLPALQRTVRRTRYILQSMWLEARRAAADPREDSGAPTAIAAIERPEPRGFAAPERSPRRSRSGLLYESRDDAHRRSFSAIDTESEGTGLTRERDYSELTLSAIQRAMKKLQSQGYEPDGIVLRVHEAEKMLEQNFDWHPGEPLPENIHLFGLPVKVQE
jgi:hypothetical protein